MNTCNSSPHTVTEFDISGLEAMLAGTLCLMSAYSHCHRGNANNPANHQGLIGLKIVSNLSCLQYQNALSPEFRKVLSKVCESWRQHSLLVSSEPAQVASANSIKSSRHASHWHAAPSIMQ